MKKGGKMNSDIFSPIGKNLKSMHIFTPIDIKFTILRKMRAPPHFNKLIWGQKYESRIGGQNY